jgi:hypothetical protein
MRCEATFTYIPGGKYDHEYCPKCRKDMDRTDMGGDS